jgi:cellulose biosynthesis protein BcsQ
MKKIIILIGNYGSGKTEIALNMAVRAAAEGKRTQVIDLDKINDYFRMSDHVKLLDEKKINLVSPTFAGAGLTQTNMPAAVGSAFAQDWDLVVFDVGGDPAGAMSLARYHSDFAALEPGQLEVYDIINVRRPMSETPEKILKLKADMEGFARQTVTGFINNSNLQAWASAQDLRDGYPIVRAASEMSGIPVVHTTGLPAFLDEFLQDEGLDQKYIGTPIPLRTYMHRSWSDFTQGI